MAYLSKLQVIRRGGKNRQYYMICPAPLAEALELEKASLWSGLSKTGMPSRYDAAEAAVARKGVLMIETDKLLPGLEATEAPRPKPVRWRRRPWHESSPWCATR